MSFEWIHENPPHWDATKAKIIGGAPDGVFDLGAHAQGDLIPGEWWRAEENGSVLGYGWMDCTWGDAEILLAVDPQREGGGVGGFILDHLEREAAVRGINYLYNVVRETHPHRERITRWLQARRFADAGEGLLKRQVGHGKRV